MPELPDVEVFRRYVDATSLHREIESVGIRDERLLAGVHPESRVGRLSEAAVGEVWRALREVLERAIEAGAEVEEMPRTYLIGQREEGAECPRCDGTVEKTEVGGRSTYLCPSCQVKEP